MPPLTPKDHVPRPGEQRTFGLHHIKALDDLVSSANYAYLEEGNSSSILCQTLGSFCERQCVPVRLFGAFVFYVIFYVKMQFRSF